MLSFRIGHGYDVHRVVLDRKMFCGCVEIPWDRGLLGHSDADVLSHAICDAMLGALSLGDIGQHFPDTDPAYEGVSGETLLKACARLCREHGYVLSNLDCIVVAQLPKLAPYIPEMKNRIAAAVGAEPGAVSVKATTEERLGFTGSSEGISAHAVCLMQKI